MNEAIVWCSINYFSLYRSDYTLSSYHQLISLVTSQQISFEAGRNLRKQLYLEVGYPLTPQNISSINLSKYLTPAKQFTVRAITEMALLDNNDLINRVKNIKGVGPWTLKGAYILTEVSQEEPLFEDAYVRKRLSEIFGLTIGIKEAKTFFDTLPDNKRSIVSYFLWRIRKTSTWKVSRGERLERSDFL